MTYLDYSHEENIVKVFKKTQIETIISHLGWEYGPIMLIYIFIIAFKLIDNFNKSNIFIVLSLIITLSITYRTIFYKKEKSLVDIIDI